MDCSLPGSSAHGFSRQGYWNGLPFPPPGDLPNTGIKPRCPALQADALPSELPGKCYTVTQLSNKEEQVGNEGGVSVGRVSHTGNPQLRMVPGFAYKPESSASWKLQQTQNL